MCGFADTVLSMEASVHSNLSKCIVAPSGKGSMTQLPATQDWTGLTEGRVRLTKGGQLDVKYPDLNQCVAIVEHLEQDAVRICLLCSRRGLCLVYADNVARLSLSSPKTPCTCNHVTRSMPSYHRAWKLLPACRNTHGLLWLSLVHPQRLTMSSRTVRKASASDPCNCKWWQ